MEHIKTQSQGHYSSDPSQKHEQSDVNIRLILAFGLFLAVSGVVLYFVLWGMYNFLDRMEAKYRPATNPMVQQGQSVSRPGTKPTDTSAHAETREETLQRLVTTFPEPRLQPNEYSDMRNFRETQEKILGQYSWIDKNTGSVRIPIDRAIQLIAERGLPAAGSTVPPTNPEVKELSNPAGKKQ